MNDGFTADVVVIGGCGHVGLPLGISLADRGLKVLLYDVDDIVVKMVNDKILPNEEPDAQEPLDRVIDSGALVATTDPSKVGDCEHVVVVIGTPIDEHLNPDPQAIPRALGLCSEYMRDGQIIVLRSTIYPGVTALVERMVERMGKDIDVAFCPERIAEGRAMVELYALPQLVGARTERARKRASRLFMKLTRDIVEIEPEEAELAKLFTNSWRYIKFAAANQLYMVANDFGLDYERVRQALMHNYPRAADLPGAGFAAGPCLFKDTMQLAAFNNNNFGLGYASMQVNEGLPMYMIAQLEKQYDLSEMKVGILGMAFKAESDDIRSSLSYKLKRLLHFKAAAVMTTDPYVKDDHTLLPLEEVIEQSDILIIGSPHKIYASLETDVPVVDIWNLLGNGTRV